MEPKIDLYLMHLDFRDNWQIHKRIRWDFKRHEAPFFGLLLCADMHFTKNVNDGSTP
jgi:hypothetical protein